MRRPRTALLPTLTILLVASVTAAPALALSPAPYFTVNGTRLVAGKTHNFASNLVEPFHFDLPEEGVALECGRLTVEKGVLLGSNEGEPGKAAGIARLTECVLTEGNGAPNCQLESEAITTNELLSEQVESVSGTGGGKQLLKEIFPASGANFVTLHFTGSGCTSKEALVSGQMAAEVLLDTAAEAGKVELGQAPEQAPSWRLKFPGTSIKEVWLITNGVGKIAKVKATVFGDAYTTTGTWLALLANGSFSPVEELWSPLP
jgi:hypothetical protein